MKNIRQGNIVSQGGRNLRGDIVILAQGKKGHALIVGLIVEEEGILVQGITMVNELNIEKQCLVLILVVLKAEMTEKILMIKIAIFMLEELIIVLMNVN